MRRNMSIHELQARRQQRCTVWAMVALAALALPLLTACGGDVDPDGSPCGAGDDCQRHTVTREEQK
jgi:hypothetical protein